MQSYNGSGIAIIVDIVGAAIVGILADVSGGAGSALLAAVIAFLVLLAMSIRVVKEWNRMPVLRLGRYKGILGPGFKTIIPIVDATPFSVDLRVISTTFSAEQTLTKDNVPVNVDAILFWQTEDPEKATLNVQSYYDSIQLSAQTAMRDVIGKSVLSQMLAGRDIIGKDIQDLIQDRVSEWGIKAISVEIRDVKIPQQLQDAMARVATSEREKDARVILAESEVLAADKMLVAAGKYKKDLYAMQLRALDMMYEISLNGNNPIIFIPTDSKGFSMPTPLGLLGIQDLTGKKMGKGAKGKGENAEEGQQE
ncbi:MAG: slipin family protein [Candidatus Micrarchaeota archaeon]|nr:slipin family protein [Candidatus Micrarchaeota archaeon]MDE1849656.1 slipin family protein [Candidatus Micrarchaeota archaeon]